MKTTDSENYPAELARLVLPRAGMTVRELRHLLFEINEQDQPLTQALLEAIVARQNAYYERLSH
jgi:hypothetical protein